MTPTNRLRFIKREVEIKRPDLGEGIGEMKVLKVLQQWYAIERSGQITPDGQWFDVPLEE